MYGDSGDSDEEGVELKPKRSKVRQATAGGKCKACRSTSHLQSNHRDCPYNKRMTDNTDPLGDVNDSRVSENSDVIHYSEEGQFVSDGGFASSESDWDFEEDIMKISACTCTCALS